MKKISIVFVVSLLTYTTITAQVTARPIKKVVTLNMPGETGSNGAAVAWHPLLKKYYTSFAGNASYPFAVFAVSGQRLSPDGLEAMLDIRGIWYNTISKKIEANGYDNKGWISYTLNAKGIPEGKIDILSGQFQPDPQSIGVFDAATKRVCFLDAGSIIFYSMKGVIADDIIELKLKSKKADQPEGELEDNATPVAEYNVTALCYTGIVNAEFAVLNYGEVQIELYNRKGILTKAFKLPDDIPLYTNFNFSYANGIWWLFDKEERTWIGFK